MCKSLLLYTGWFTEITIDNKGIYCLAVVFFLDHPVDILITDSRIIVQIIYHRGNKFLYRIIYFFTQLT